MKNWNRVADFLAAIYFSEKYNLQEKEEIYNKWFEEGKFRKEEFFEEYQSNIDADSIKLEIDNHKQWKNQTDIAGTPTILFNGYELPYQYSIEDIIYFMDLKTS
ncbi:MAG: hypothetical protein LBV43_09175 [Prevotella sp.]|jgi:protein-disulfide isomerase|nr:hypothetical protein [Prevotella sp.]